jgi:phosphohistidine phosphatase
MRQLLLLRHAKSSWDERDTPDHGRPLNRRGQQAAAAMRTAMEGLGLAPDVILVSTSRRTLQTLEALEPWADTPLVDRLDSLYLAPAPTILKAIQDVGAMARSVMVVGHNPGLHELAMLLVGAQAASFDNADIRRLAAGFPSCALAEFTVTVPWQTLDEGGGRLVRFLCPHDLPGAGG